MELHQHSFYSADNEVSTEHLKSENVMGHEGTSEIYP